MKRFAKLVEVEEGQALATIEADEDDESKHQLHVRIYYDGATIIYKLGYPTYEECIENMEAFNEAKARELYQNLEQMLNE